MHVDNASVIRWCFTLGMDSSFSQLYPQTASSSQEGSGLGVVIAVGNENQIGKIAGQVSKSSRLTPLQRELNRFVVIIASFAFIVGVVVISVWAGYLRVQHPTFMNTATMIANAISVIVAFVPEGA